MIITHTQMHSTGKFSQHRSVIWPVWINRSVFVYASSGFWVGILLLSLKLQKWCLVRATTSFTFTQTIECGFTLEVERDIIITYTQMHRTDKYSQHSSIISQVWLNGSVFISVLCGSGFESCCSHLNFRNAVLFEQGLP